MLREAERDVDHRHHPIILAAATTGTLQNDKQNCRQSSRDESEDDDEEKEEEEGNVTGSDVSLGDESLQVVAVPHSTSKRGSRASRKWQLQARPRR